MDILQWSRTTNMYLSVGFSVKRRNTNVNKAHANHILQYIICQAFQDSTK